MYNYASDAVQNCGELENTAPGPCPCSSGLDPAVRLSVHSKEATRTTGANQKGIFSLHRDMFIISPN